MKRETTATVIWLASLMRSWPMKRFSVKICAKLKPVSAESKFGRLSWFLYGVYT